MRKRDLVATVIWIVTYGLNSVRCDSSERQVSGLDEAVDKAMDAADTLLTRIG